MYFVIIEIVALTSYLHKVIINFFFFNYYYMIVLIIIIITFVVNYAVINMVNNISIKYIFLLIFNN